MKKKFANCNKCDDKGEPSYIPREECDCEITGTLPENDFAMEVFSLEGKITKKHANEIEEILEILLSRASRAGAEKMLKFIADDMGWEESEEFYKNKVEEICK